MRLVISASSASLARALTRHTASTSTPVLTPMRSSRLATSSVATFPVAPGMNGQPPRPPNAVSKRVTPCLNAAIRFAMPSPRVSWRCSTSGTPGAASFTALTRRSTDSGSARPAESAIASSSTPEAAMRAASLTTRSSGTSSMPQPNAHCTPPRTIMPRSRANAIVASRCSSASARPMPALRRECSSLAESDTSTYLSPAAAARSTPLRFRARPE